LKETIKPLKKTSDNMLQTPDPIKRYQAAEQRFFKPIVEEFFRREFPKLFGPIMRERIAKEIEDLFLAMHPSKDQIKPGQILWNALDKNTRGDSSNRKFVPVLLTVVNQADIQALSNGAKRSVITKNAIARMIKEAYEQGGVLSMRDLGLLTLNQPSNVSQIRLDYEKENDERLPHTGSLHDMGSCMTHKEQIVHKVVVEKKDPADVAKQTNHTQKAVDRYLKDYYRVKTVYRKEKNIEQIHIITDIAKHVINQYLAIIENYDQENEK
jgi:hypothetical protein